MKTKVFQHSDQGFTLIETIVSLVIFLTILGFMVPMFANQRLNTLQREIEMGAVAISQEIMDELRRVDISTLPSTGSTTTLPSGLSTTSVDRSNKGYSATIFYCENATYCGSEARHIRVQVRHHGQTVHQVETVYSRIQ